MIFDDAALRAAQIGFDLSIKGAMAFFCWPSQGTLAGYTADEATIEASDNLIAEFVPATVSSPFAVMPRKPRSPMIGVLRKSSIRPVCCRRR